MKCLKEEAIKIDGGTIPIKLMEDKDDNGVFYLIEIDGVEWVCIENMVHAVVLFNMMKDHITEYMHYEKL